MGALGGLLSRAAAEEMRRSNKQVLFVWLDGGMSQLESWDPKPNTHFRRPVPQHPDERARRPFLRADAEAREADAPAVRGAQRVAPRTTRTRPASSASSAAIRRRAACPIRTSARPWRSSSGPARASCRLTSGSSRAAAVSGPEDGGFLGPKYGSLAFGDGKPPENLLRHPSLTAEEDDERNELRARLNERYAAHARREYTEANSYVFDTARELMKRADIFDTTQAAGDGRRALRRARSRAAHAHRAHACSKRACAS